MFRPDAKALIEIARQTLVEEVLADPGVARYQCLMVASALGIALRELDAQQAQRRMQAEVEQTASRLLGAPVGTAQHGFAASQQRLAAAIRAGKTDPDSETGARIRNLLLLEVRVRLAIDNPKALNEANTSPTSRPEQLSSKTGHKQS